MIYFSCASTEPPLTEYEMQRDERLLFNSRVFRSLGIQQAADILKKSRETRKTTNATHQDSRKTTNATREDPDPLYQPGDDEAGEDMEGVADNVPS